MNPRFVLTGGPGAGKTSTLNALKAQGYACVLESPREIIQERKAMGLSPRPNPEDFAKQCLEADIAKYKETAVGSAPVFFDRGVVDALSMCESIFTPARIAKYVERHPYNETAFLFPPWQDIYCVDNERDHSFEHAVAVFEILEHWYERWGYTPIEVPRETPEKRADFILAATRNTH